MPKWSYHIHNTAKMITAFVRFAGGRMNGRDGDDVRIAVCVDEGYNYC